MNFHLPTSCSDFAHLRTTLFVDTLYIQFKAVTRDAILGILRDEHGMVCRQLETRVEENESELSWKGLDDLPYGIYTLQLSQGHHEVLLRIVKRV